MSCSAIIAEITNRLRQIGINPVLGKDADLEINCDFLDAAWDTGSKKISYDASVLADEEEHTLYMWEKTTEKGAGLSFGSDNETFIQQGSTIFRKVKNVQYGPDGKAYEFSFDIGAIAKAVKETAGLYDWKFKMVLKRDKARRPAGFVPSVTIPVQEAQSQKQSDMFCPNCGNKIRSRRKVLSVLRLPDCRGPALSGACLRFTISAAASVVRSEYI